MDIAIITGASSGMGRQFVLQAAAMEHYDEIWVIARREERLEELAQMTKTPLRILALDLKESDSLSQIKKMLEERKLLVRLLVNAAGFGKFGPTAGLSDEEVSDMVQLNVYALAVLTKAVLPYMKSGGRIIQMASVAAFQPLPDMNIYAASKAFVLSFSRALGRELKRRGIMVTAVCPGWTRTEFFTVAQSTEHPESVRNFPGMARPADVVRKALGDSVKGKAVSVYGFHNKGHRLLAKLFPHRLVMAVWERIKN